MKLESQKSSVKKFVDYLQTQANGLEPPLKIGYKMAVNEMAAFAKTFSKI
jgi:hypothetical protein